MVYFTVLGHKYLVLGSSERTTDLLEKRSSNFSDRPRLPMILELYVSDFLDISKKKMFLIKIKTFVFFRMKWEANFGLLPYGLSWRKHRRSFHQYFNIDAVTKYRPIQRREVHAFLRRLLVTPEDFFKHIRQ